MDFKKVDLSKREFIKSFASIYAAGNIMFLPGGHNILSKKETEVEITSTFNSNTYSDNHYQFTSLVSGMSAAALVLNNIDFIYSALIILITIVVLLFFGVPGTEYLFYQGTAEAIPFIQ